jgi:hypothetical protein
LACRQDLVVRADADDLCLPERCAQQVAAMVARPQVAAMSTPILEFIQDPRHFCSVRTVPVGASALRRRSLWRNPLNHPAVILRRMPVLAAGGYRDRPGFEDYDLWLRLLQAGAELDNLPQPLVLAKVGPQHLARRRGLAYAVRELRFLLACGRQGSLSWPRLLLLALLPLHVLAPFLHAHTETDPRAGMQTGLHLPGLEALEDDTRHGPTWGLRNPPLIEEADLGRRQTDHDLDDAAAPGQDLQPLPAAQRIAPVARDASPPAKAPRLCAKTQ